MFKLTLTAFGAAVALSATTPALALDNDIRARPQLNLNSVFADLSLYGKWIGGDVRGTSVAIGNNFVTEAAGSTAWYNDQLMLADVGATLNAKLKDVHGDVDLQVVGICNNAALNVTESGYSEAWSRQRCDTLDPYAIANVGAFGVGGDVSVSAAAIANNLAVDATTGQLHAGFVQANASAVYANVNAVVADVGGDVTASAIAIGNNASITSRFGK
jgi:hypothetical protein